MNDFFNLRGAAVFRVLSLISTVALWLTILLFVIGLMMGFFGEQETKAIGWAMVDSQSLPLSLAYSCSASAT